jgi:hypothetical protein
MISTGWIYLGQVPRIRRAKSRATRYRDPMTSIPGDATPDIYRITMTRSRSYGIVSYITLTRIERSVEENLEVRRKGGLLLQYKEGLLEESVTTCIVESVVQEACHDEKILSMRVESGC